MAKRDKLTQRQKRQIAKTQKSKLSTASESRRIGDLGEVRHGLIISRFGEQADVLDAITGELYRCFLRQNLGAPVPGDKVKFRTDSNQQGVIESINDRVSLLQRPSHHKGLKPVVANIDRVFVLVAPLPDFSSILLDRYLIAIENAGIDVVIIANKWDLTSEIENQSINEQLRVYESLNYSILRISTKTNLGKQAFKEKIEGRSSILVGQSGVGKSSVINWIFPSQQLATQNVSENSRLGLHTTTASQLFFDPEDCGDSGFIIDSPGIREFGLWHLKDNEIASGFCEFRKVIGSCKFRDCKHSNEPGCQIIESVRKGEIQEVRWLNYTKILANNIEYINSSKN